MTFKPHSILGRYIGPCPDCGSPNAVIMADFPLLPDGCVDMNAKPNATAKANCRACHQRQNDEVKRQNRIARWQKKCLKGKGRLTR